MARAAPTPDHSDEVTKSIVDHRFGDSGVPTLSDEQVARIRSLREHARLFARHVVSSVPNSWEREKALEEIDNALSWGVKGISRWE
jgi:hypothetical protein